jgi:hypothetical protein
MSYPVGTPVHTFTLETAAPEGALTSPVAVVIRENDGEVRAVEFSDYRAVQTMCARWENDGVRVLAVVEGETDLSTGTSTVWVRR